MKKIIFTIITVTMVVITAIVILKGKDLIPSFKNKMSRNERLTNQLEQSGSTNIIYNTEDVINTKGLKITINSATISKELNELPSPNLESMAIPPSIDINKSFDSNYNFMDNNNYLQLELTIENTLNDNQMLSLNNIQIVNEKNWLITEAVLTSTSTNFNKSMFQYEIKEQEKIHIFMGYIITDEVKQQNIDNLYLSINLNGTSEMNKQKDYDRRTVKLNFD